MKEEPKDKLKSLSKTGSELIAPVSDKPDFEKILWTVANDIIRVLKGAKPESIELLEDTSIRMDIEETWVNYLEDKFLPLQQRVKELEIKFHVTQTWLDKFQGGTADGIVNSMIATKEINELRERVKELEEENAKLKL